MGFCRSVVSCLSILSLSLLSLSKIVMTDGFLWVRTDNREGG